MQQYRIDGLKPYVLGSIAEAVAKARREGRDIIDLSQANPDLPPPTIAVDKLVEASLRPQNHRYSTSQGITRLREAIVTRYRDKYGVSLDPGSEVCVTLGTKEGLAHLLLALAMAGDNVIVPTPAYPVHSAAIAIAGASQTAVELPLDEMKMELNQAEFFERLEHVYSNTWPRARFLILSFPHNPTTLIVTKEFWEGIVKFARENNVIVIHDFAYADICYEGYRAPSLLSVPGAKDIGVEFFSLSKAYGIAGWRVGFCVGKPELVATLKKIKSYLDFGIFQPIQIAAAKVIEEGDSIVSENIGLYQARRDVLVSGLNSIGWNVASPKASVFVWARIPERFQDIGSVEFAKSLLEYAKVGVCPGGGFDVAADQYVRFALVDNEIRLRCAVKNIDKFINS